ncbi:MAG: hypothetical protein BRC29_01220 [Nanohaloarchaea archaeon SW_7_43_1]|nr:MAG: hypothetical protein BRC29_01220 [Nanohaloarchaea archaeon SW_7_43_1]
MKGSIDITVLIVAVVPMVLLLILSAYFIAEDNLNAELIGEMRFEESKFQTISVHSQIMDNDTRRKIGLYSVQENQVLKNDVEERAEDILSSYTDYYRFQAAGDSINVESEADGNRVRFSTYVPSPKQEMVKATTALEITNQEDQ